MAPEAIKLAMPAPPTTKPAVRMVCDGGGGGGGTGGSLLTGSSSSFTSIVAVCCSATRNDCLNGRNPAAAPSTTCGPGSTGNGLLSTESPSETPSSEIVAESAPS